MIDVHNVLNMVVLGVSVLMAVVILTSTMYLTSLGSEEASKATESVSNIVVTEDADYAAIKGPLSGIQVRELVQKYNDSGIYTLTLTKNVPDGFYNTSGIDDTSSINYVKDDDEFTATLARDVNNTVVGVTFIQQGVESKEFNEDDAKLAGFGQDYEIMLSQMSLFNQAKSSSDLCTTVIRSFEKWADKLKEEYDSEAAMTYKKVTGATADDTEVIAHTNSMKSQTEFYNTLASYLSDWATRKVNLDLIYSTVLDSEDEEPEEDEEQSYTYSEEHTTNIDSNNTSNHAEPDNTEETEESEQNTNPEADSGSLNSGGKWDSGSSLISNPDNADSSTDDYVDLEVPVGGED